MHAICNLEYFTSYSSSSAENVGSKVLTCMDLFLHLAGCKLLELALVQLVACKDATSSFLCTNTNQ